MTPEDIGDIFQALEDALFAMAIRTMKHHQNWEEEEGFKWTQWQAEQINGLRAYRQNVSALTDYHFNLAKKAIEAFLREAYEGSVSDAAGLIARYGIGGIHPGFFGVNSKKLDVLINEAIQNIDTKRYAAINRMNSGYTDMLRKADMFAQSGSFTIPQVIDMAAKDFLSAGLNCVEYSNGNRVNIASYAEMALRTSSSEVTRQANGDVRNELGEYLVVSNVIAMTCPICQKWQGKVMIDDVYSNGKPDGKHKLVSESKADGFMHPNCRHQLFMYIEGVTKVADLPNDVQTRERYDAEQKQRYYERQIRKYKRLREGAVDPTNRKKYDARVKEWTERHDKFLESRDYLRKNPKRLGNMVNIRPKDGIINIEIDEFTPCLRRLKDDQIVQTSIKRLSPTKKMTKGWEFDWTLPEKQGAEVYGLYAEGDERLQGLLAVKPSRGCLEVSLVESAPFNNGHNMRVPGKEYSGVGAHLFAEAVRQSYDAGNDGVVFFQAKSDLIEYYKDLLGATLTNPRYRLMMIDERAAYTLFQKYYGKK